VNFSTSCNGGPWSAGSVPDGGQVDTTGSGVNVAQIQISFDNGAGQTLSYNVIDGTSYHFAHDSNGNLDLFAD
jgi:hypothetical protein